VSISNPVLRPQKISSRDGFLDFQWSDGLSQSYPLRWLRETCACAVCLSISPRDKLDKLAPEALRMLLKVKSIEAIGNYGFAVTWGDKHRSIYDFSRVRAEFMNLPLHAHIAAIETPQKAAL
jgi:DUF971 family protein